MTLSLNIETLAQYGLNVKRNWLLSIFAIALGMLHTSSMAQCTSSGGTISTAVNSTCTLTSGTLTITGTGSITTPSSSSTGAGGILSSGTTTINNNGSISTAASNQNGDGISNSGTTTINNNGSISTSGSGAYGVYNSGNISTLNNTGTISVSGGQNAYGIGNNGTITTLNNTGSISTTNDARYGIQTYGIITTLNNQQGKSGNNPLTYSGRLPVNYNVIVASSNNYGQLSISNTFNTMVFGISGLSTTSSSIVGQTLTGVLQGFGSNLSSYISSGLTSSNGYTYSFAQQGSSGTWDLLITACSVCSVSNISSGMTVPLASVGASPVLSGGTLELLNGDSSSTAFSVTNPSTIQGPSSGSATLSGIFSGLGSLTFTGSGTTVFSGANTYTGGTTVSSGTLQGNASSLQGEIVNNSTVVFDQSTSGTYSGVMSGSGALTKQNSGTLVLTGANTYSGGTTVSAGSLQGNTTSLQGAIINNSQVVFDQATDGTYSGVMSGSGSLTNQNPGTLILTGANVRLQMV